MKKKTEPEIKTDKTCYHYIHGICLKTVNQIYHTSIPKGCDCSAEYCDKNA